jgi:glucose 1-dehydrogenase
LTHIPYQRIGEPEDIGRVAVMLASDLSDYITGANILLPVQTFSRTAA